MATVNFRVYRVLPEGNFEETSGIPTVFINDSDIEYLYDPEFCKEFIKVYGSIVGVIKTHDIKTKPDPYRTLRSIIGRVDRGGHSE